MSVPPLVVCTAAAVLYALGGRGRGASATRRRRLQELSFYTGILAMLVSLEPPFDNLADRSFAMHMTQHVVLITVTPPLVVLGRPWPRMWLWLPSSLRRTTARSVARGAWSAPLRLAARASKRPFLGWALMAAALAAWHVPALYDAAVANEGVHFLEHLCFVGSALVYWATLLDAPPVRARIDYLRRAGWFAAGAVPGWILAIVLSFAGTALYPVYIDAHRPLGFSALSDQALAAGVMWVPGSLAFFVAFFLSVYRWLEPEPSARPEPRPEELSWTT